MNDKTFIFADDNFNKINKINKIIDIDIKKNILSKENIKYIQNQIINKIKIKLNITIPLQNDKHIWIMINYIYGLYWTNNLSHQQEQ